MNQRSLLSPENPAFQSEWRLENVTTTFFKCTKWQVEITTDQSDCPFHYFCDSNYAGNYPPVIDRAVLLFSALLYLIAMLSVLIEISRGNAGLSRKRRCWLPSGPVALPLTLLILAKGSRINTVFPLSSMGPALLLLIQASALGFEPAASKDANYILLETSLVSGILHAALFLDSIILPYYTGLDALVLSAFSGECASCICRTTALTVGGTLVSYKGMSATTFTVVGFLCSRLVSQWNLTNQMWATQIIDHEEACSRFMTWVKERKFSIALSLIKSLAECLSWVCLLHDSVYLILASPEGGSRERATFGCIFVLICLLVINKMKSRYAAFKRHCCRTDESCSNLVSGKP